MLGNNIPSCTIKCLPTANFYYFNAPGVSKIWSGFHAETQRPFLIVTNCGGAQEGQQHKMGTAYAQYRFVMAEVSLYNSNVTKRTYIPEFAFRHPALNHLAVLIEADPINNKEDLVCQPMVPFPALLRRTPACGSRMMMMPP